MGRTLAIHWAPTTHGTWLHGDSRGSWRDGQLIGPDPYLLAEARARMIKGAVILTPQERQLVGHTFGFTVRQQNHRVLAATIQATHCHLILAPLKEHIDKVVARLKYRSASAVLGRRRENPTRRVKNPTGTVGLSRSLWTGGKFITFIYSHAHLRNAVKYVHLHNERDGLPADPYDWITPYEEYVGAW
jgi:REP element-mobilizing transposase RayT